MTLDFLDDDKVKGIKQSATEGKKKYKRKSAKEITLNPTQMVTFYTMVIYLCEMVEKLNSDLAKRKDAV